jgi:hypothetical protein
MFCRKDTLSTSNASTSVKQAALDHSVWASKGPKPGARTSFRPVRSPVSGITTLVLALLGSAGCLFCPCR